MSFRDYVDLFRTHLRLIVIVTVGGLLLAVLGTATVRPSYTAVSQVLFTSGAGETGQDRAFAGQYIQTRMPTYVELVRSRQVLQPVIVELELRHSFPQLAAAVTASFTPATSLLSVTAVDGDARRAQAISLRVTQILIGVIEEREVAPAETKGGQPQQVVSGDLVTAPDIPSGPSSPSYGRNAVAGTMLGLLAGVGIALLRRARRQPVLPVVVAVDGGREVVPRRTPAPDKPTRRKRNRKSRR